MSLQINFSSNLRAARARANLSQMQLAQACGYGQSNISKWDRGESTPTVNQLLILAKALGTTAAELLTGCQIAPTEPDAAIKRTSQRAPGPKGPPLMTRRSRRQPSLQVP